MIAVIIAGGQGTRLWPLSTSDKPKHLLSLTGEQSLLQDAYKRAAMVTDIIYVVTDKSHAELVRKQLPKLPAANLIVEPARRGTAACIVLALAHVAASHPPDEVVAFFHADHHIQNKAGFADTVQFAARSARQYSSIALIGIHPDYPATGFGYIKVGERLDGVFKVAAFKEKPDAAMAKRYVESGQYLWNLGLFAGTCKLFEQEFAAYHQAYSRGLKQLKQLIGKSQSPDKAYTGLPKEAIDTALIEKSRRTIVVPGTFDWMDIGSFKDLHDVMPKSDQLANAIQGDNCCVIDTTNSMVISHNKPVAVIGLDNVVVIDAPEGVLVCHKDHAQKVKQAANHMGGQTGQTRKNNEA